MKYGILLIAVCLMQSAKAQSLYGSISAGYHSILNSEQPPSFLTNSYHQISSPWFWSQEDFEFQHVLTTDVSAGYFFNEKVGVELSAVYVKPRSLFSNDGFTRKELSGNFWRINPKFVLNIPVRDFNLFTKIGGVIGTGRTVFRQEFQNDGSLNLTYNQQSLVYEYTERPSFGFTASLGVSKAISKRVELFSEIQLTHHVFSPIEGKMTEYTFDDINALDEYEYDPYFSQIEFGNESEWYFWNSDDTSQPQKLYRRSYSLASIGIVCGVKFTLWKKP
jgi:hypothetical protein